MSTPPIIARLFGPSPIAPIQQHMETCEQCAQLLTPFFDAVLHQDWALASQLADDISRLEKEANDIKRSIRMGLHRSLFLPFSRTDLLKVLQVQDKIANNMKDVAGVVLGRRMQFPTSIQAQLVELSAACVEAVSLAREAMDELNELIVTGFSGWEIDFIGKILERLQVSEQRSDECQAEVRKILFEHESQLNAVDVIFIYRMIDLIGDIADNAQAVGNRLMYLIAR